MVGPQVAMDESIAFQHRQYTINRTPNGALIPSSWWPSQIHPELVQCHTATCLTWRWNEVLHTVCRRCTFEAFRTIKLRCKIVCGHFCWTVMPYSEVMSSSKQRVSELSTEARKRREWGMPRWISTLMKGQSEFFFWLLFVTERWEGRIDSRNPCKQGFVWLS